MRFSLFIMLLAVCSSVVYGQSLPSTALPAASGDVQKVQQPKPKVVLPLMQPVTLESSKAMQAVQSQAMPSAATDVDSQSVYVSGYRFTGNRVISHAELQAVVDSDRKKKLTLPQLEEVTSKVTKLYRGRGYLVARAYLPPQQSADGTIEIAVLEGHISEVVLKNSSTLSPERLEKTLAANLCPEGDRSKDSPCSNVVLQESRIERATLLVRDLPGVSMTAQLQPGKGTGTSDVVANVITSKPSVNTMGVDNYGTGALGTVRYNVGTDRNNVTGIGDQLAMTVSGTAQGSYAGSVAYSRPINYTGLRLGVGYARSQYQLGKGYESIKAYGTGDAFSAYLNYPVVRTLNRSMYWRILAERRAMKDRIDAADTSFFERKENASLLRFSVNGDSVDAVGGGGYNVYGLTFSAGHIGSTNASDLAKQLGSFSKLGFNFSRQQSLGGSWTLYSSLLGQTTDKNLHGSEQMGLGGPNGVRAYPSGEGGGSVGALATVELRYSHAMPIVPPTNLTYALFVDRGWIDPYRYYWLANQSRDNRALTGTGLGITLQSTSMFVRVIYATHKTAEASEIDKARNYQFWLQAGGYF